MGIGFLPFRSAAGYSLDGYGDFASSAYLSQATVGTADDLRAFTVHALLRRNSIGDGSAGSRCTIFSGFNSGQVDYLSFRENNHLEFMIMTPNVYKITTTAKFESTTDWYPITAIYDSANATAGDRMRLYLGETRITSFSTEIQPLQTTTVENWHVDSAANMIGEYTGTSEWLRADLARFSDHDGQVLTPDNFGAESGGDWTIGDVSALTFGAVGSLLEGKDDVAAGTDSSGNGNNWAKTGTITGTAQTVGPSVTIGALT